MRLLLLWLGAATLTRAAHFQDDWVMEYPRPSGAQDSPDADLAIRVDFSSLKGPGQRLLNGIAMGVTSAREVFESQFILDMSLATGVHTDRIVVLNVTEGDVHFAWRWTTTVIRFRILASLYLLVLHLQDLLDLSHRGTLPRVEHAHDPVEDE